MGKRGVDSASKAPLASGSKPDAKKVRTTEPAAVVTDEFTAEATRKVPSLHDTEINSKSTEAAAGKWRCPRGDLSE